MRKHRRYERVCDKVITVQTHVPSPRELMSMVVESADVEVRARKGYYANGSESYPIPRTMSIAKMAALSSRPQASVAESSVSPSAREPVQEAPAIE